MDQDGPKVHDDKHGYIEPFVHWYQIGVDMIGSRLKIPIDGMERMRSEWSWYYRDEQR
jgi:hypothetical protein